MKHTIAFLTTLFLFACNTAPTIVPDTTKDNVIMQKLQWEIQNHSQVSTNWGWILWYLSSLSNWCLGLQSIPS